MPKAKKKKLRGKSEAALARLLDRRNDHPEELASIDAEITTQFEQRVAVLVLDMCGFSRLTIRHGIIHYLALIRRMHGAVLPEVDAAGGRLVKTEADNVFAVFSNPIKATRCAQAIQRALATMNAALPADWDVHVGIGIGYGPLLMIGDHDLFGSEMNLASKLGEDTAEAGDVLLTEAAFAALGAQKKDFTGRRTRISGLTLPYHAWTPKTARKAARKRARTSTPLRASTARARP